LDNEKADSDIEMGSDTASLSGDQQPEMGLPHAQEVTNKTPADEDTSFSTEYHEEVTRQRNYIASNRISEWTDEAAIQRYLNLSKGFNQKRYSRTRPLTFYSVPWPMLYDPMIATIQNVDGTVAKTFFEEMRKYQTPEQYTVLLQNARLMFHPDRWDSGRKYAAIADDQLSGMMKKAVGEIAQSVGEMINALEHEGK
jgi:hypothetical protein